MIHQPDIPIDYLLTCSQSSRDGFRLSQRNRAAERTKMVRQITEEAIRAEAYALLAEWLEEYRNRIMSLIEKAS